MTVEELFSSIRNTLQDSAKTYWEDLELLDYYNECTKVMSAERLENKTTTSIALIPATFEYNTDGILRYISCIDNLSTDRLLYPDDGTGDDDVNGIIIKDNNRIYVNDPTVGTTLTMKIVSMPVDSTLLSTVRSGDESAIKYYVLSKAYEKDTDMEHFQKSGYFASKYKEAFKVLLDASSMNYKARERNVTQAYFY